MDTQKATFAAGCFWGVEEAFRNTDGVVDTTVGYTGGEMPEPTYKDVCSGKTGHAEVVEVVYDPSTVSYEELLDVFFDKHNPTTKNRQGWDIGTQYRSAIFFHSPEQEAAAQAAKDKRDEALGWGKKIVTEITPASDFYKAEDYHQQYVAKQSARV